MSDDDDDTNPKRRRAATASGLADNPSDYLREDPTPDARLLVQHVGLHQGAHVPLWMLAEVAIRQHRTGAWVEDLAGLLRRVRRWAMAAVAAVAVNMVPFTVYIVSHVKASGAAEERAEAVKREYDEYRTGIRRELEDMHQDIRELRREMRRMSGGAPETGTVLQPDRLSSWFPPIDQIVLPPAWGLSACTRAGDIF